MTAPTRRIPHSPGAGRRGTPRLRPAAGGRQPHRRRAAARAGHAVSRAAPDAEGRLGRRVGPPAGRGSGRRAAALLPADAGGTPRRLGGSGAAARAWSPSPAPTGCCPVPDLSPTRTCLAEARATSSARRRIGASRGGWSGCIRRRSAATSASAWSTRSRIGCARGAPPARRRCVRACRAVADTLRNAPIEWLAALGQLALATGRQPAGV